MTTDSASRLPTFTRTISQTLLRLNFPCMLIKQYYWLSREDEAGDHEDIILGLGVGHEFDTSLSIFTCALNK